MFDFTPWLENIGIANIDYDLLWTAFTHSSYKGMGHNVEDNERLEFLGDAVLDLITADELYEDKSLNESDMTEIRKDYVKNDRLAKIFDLLEVDSFMKLQMNLPLSNKVKGGFIEAFFGAFYKEKGYNESVKLWHRIQLMLGSEFSSLSYDKRKNAKSIIQEYCQRKQFILQYHLTEKSGPDHKPLFTAEINLSPGNSKREFEKIFKSKEKPYVNEYANGWSIKHAEMRAAEKMCDRIGLKFRPGE